MIRRAWRTALMLIGALGAGGTACAQYYNTGQAPASQRWSMLGSDSLRMVFPVGFEGQARRTLFYMEQASPAIAHGYQLPPLRTPVVFWTENFYSNGLSMLAPRRIEMVGIPAIDTYSEPWLKQLATHEYRHMVQYGNLNRSTVRVFGWFFGQQAPLVAAGLLPFWFIEGDAVMAETQFSTFGRALQPSFTMHYRAVGEEMLRRRNPDKWFCGSYRDYVPSHYELGFQLVAHADRTYDEYLGAGLTRYTSDYPFLIFTSQLALRKYYGTSTRRLFRDTFAELNDLWRTLPEENSPQVVSPPVKIYTVYSDPLFVSDSVLLVLKEDLDRTSRFVEIDLRDGSERTVCHTGAVSSRPSYRDGRVAWTEYRQSSVWGQKVNSRLCVMDLASGRSRQLPDEGDGVLYPVLMPDGEMACVRYHADGYYAIEYLCGERGRLEYVFPASVSIHGLAWDDWSERFYFIGLGDDGMWIGGVDFAEASARRCDVTTPAYVTLGDLTAADGMLYFNSIASGKDEVHTIDLMTGAQYRMSESRYGSFAPSPSPTGEFVAVTTYERDGYKVALQEVEYREEVPWSAVPRNVVNAPLRPWNLPSADDMIFTQTEREESQQRYPARRYRKGTHLFNLHSWAPIYYAPDELMADQSLDARIGATLISQNLLGSMESSLGYGWTPGGYSVVRGHVGYYGWAPKIEVTALWSDRPHTVVDLRSAGEEGYAAWGKGSSTQVSARVYVPWVLSSGYRIRSFVPQIQYTFDNAEYISPATGRSERSSIVLGTLQYSDYVRSTRLDLQPRWGYMVRANVAGNPFSRLYTTAWSIYGRAYLPGLFLHHGVTVQAAWQQAAGSGILFRAIDLQPRMRESLYPTDYFAASFAYRLPVAYPDWGLSGVFFLKRIALDLDFDYACCREGSSSAWRNLYTYGGSLSLDVTPFRMPDEATCTLKVGVYKPRYEPVLVTFGFAVPF